jgi:hypothetical protein
MITLGQKVRDQITGFEGIAVAKVEYINGCIQFGIKPKSTDGKMPETVYLDEQTLEVVDAGVAIEARRTGGENMDTPKSFGLSSH